MPTMPTMPTMPDDLLVEVEDAQRDGQDRLISSLTMCSKKNKSGSLDDALTRKYLYFELVSPNFLRGHGDGCSTCRDASRLVKGCSALARTAWSSKEKSDSRSARRDQAC
jgi:hypothetical protein